MTVKTCEFWIIVHEFEVDGSGSFNIAIEAVSQWAYRVHLSNENPELYTP